MYEPSNDWLFEGDEDSGQKVPEEDRSALDEYQTIGNADLVTDVREEVDRVDTSEFDSSECEAFGDVIQGLAYLQESLSEPEERRPNAKVGWSEPDD